MGKYLTIFRLAAIHTIKNYKALIGASIFLITCLLIFSHIWQIAAIRLGGIDLHPDQLLWFIAFNEWVLISLPDLYDDMEHDLRSGRLAYLLPRPLSYLASIFFEGLGALSVNLLVLGVITFSFTWIKIGHITFDPSAFPFMLLIGLLAGCVGILFHMLIGLAAFWFHQVGPFQWMWEKLLLTLGGLMLPLAAYPEWLRKIAYCTPFPAILGGRSALAIHFTLRDVLFVTGSLLAWAIFVTACLLILYRRGLRIVNIGGG